MADVLVEKETIYSEEVDMLINGSTAKEVRDFIENKHSNKQENKENLK